MPNKAEVTSASGSPWIFFALTYGSTWLFWIPAAVSGQDVNASAWLIAYILGGFGPSAVGIVLLYRSNDKASRHAFWRRVVDIKRISAGWYVFILLVFPVLLGFSFLLDALVSGSKPGFETLAQIAADPLMLIGMVVIGIVTGPLSEELGWRGFALDRLQARWSGLVSSLILGLFWWGWHLPLFFVVGAAQYEWGWGSLRFWSFLFGVIPLSILMTWVYNHNGRSILSAVLLHFAHNLTLNLVHPVSAAVTFYQTVLLFATAIGVVILCGRADVRHAD
jgi:membrane protease YdiL (CAAX protease family)